MGITVSGKRKLTPSVIANYENGNVSALSITFSVSLHHTKITHSYVQSFVFERIGLYITININNALVLILMLM